MSSQSRVDRYRLNVAVPLELMAKLHTAIKGKKVKAESIGGRKIRVADRDMTPSDMVTALLEERLSGIVISADNLKWMEDASRRIQGLRDKADKAVKEGAFRKPKSEWKKRGRVAGKKYPKLDAAMKKLGEKRQQMKKEGKQWRKPKNGE